MARFSRLDTVLITLRTGLIPVVPTADASTTIGVVDALADGGVRVVELLPGQLSAAEEQVVVRVADPQVRGWHVAQHGPDRSHVSPGTRRR